MTRKTCIPGPKTLTRHRRVLFVAAAALLLPAAGASALLPGLDPLGGISASQSVSSPAGQVAAHANSGEVCADANLDPAGVTGAATSAAQPALGAAGGVTGTASGAVGSVPVVGGVAGSIGGLPNTATGLAQQASVSVSSQACVDVPSAELPALPDVPLGQSGSGSGRGPISSAIHNGTDAVGAAIKAAWDSVASLF